MSTTCLGVGYFIKKKTEYPILDLTREVHLFSIRRETFRFRKN